MLLLLNIFIKVLYVSKFFDPNVGFFSSITTNLNIHFNQEDDPWGHNYLK